MTTPVLSTKLYIPPLRSSTVLRQRLFDRINEGSHRKLILVSASAGFGKTTLISEWIAKYRKMAGWLSLDDGDSDLFQFLHYLIAAFQTIEPSFGRSILGLLESPQPPPPDTLLTVFINEITGLDRDFFLVLDDYHRIDSKPIDNALAFFLDHMPPRTHVIITTRTDPDLPLSRLRARDQLTELRAEDLSFTLEETSQFLNGVMELNLEKGDIAELERRTEGWIAGLQLAAISMRGQKDPGSFIHEFSGSHHFVLDYLIEEVIRQQPAKVQTFLLCTSILERMCGPLCDALLESKPGTGQEILAELDQSNLFIVHLDNERNWFRYHHLFADLLRQRLRQKPPFLSSLPVEMTADEIENELHIRASQWYEANGLEVEAFQHAASANDLDRTERLIDGHGMPLYFRGTITPVLHWLESLPTEIMNERPSLWVTFGAATMISGHPTQVEPRLLAAEKHLEKIRDENRKRDLNGQIAGLRALAAAAQNDLEKIIFQANRAMELLSPDNVAIRTLAAFSLGTAYEFQNQRSAAIKEFNEVFTIARNSGNFMISVAALSSLANLQLTENKLTDALETYRRAAEIVNDPEQWLMFDTYYGLARINYERNELSVAEENARHSIRLAPQIECGMVISAAIVLARIQQVRGNLKDAAECLAKAGEFARTRSLGDHAAEMAAAQIDLLLRRGQVETAEHLADTHGLPLSQARVCLARGDAAGALSIIEQYRWKMLEMDRPDEQLKALTLQSVAFFQAGDTGKAVRLLCDALNLAEPEGFMRLFLDEGPHMKALVTEAAARGIKPEYTARLLAAFRSDEESREKPSTSHHQDLIEPLTPRELDVLRLIAQGLSNQEIAEKLFLALSTVKGHSRVIFDKLQVQRRTEAVARARELDLL